MDLDYGSDDEGLEIAAKEDLLLLVHVYAFGSTEDGRLGVLNTDSPPPSSMKTLYPHPIDMSWALATDKTQSLSHEQYVCEMVACGNRHTIFLMKNCLREDPVKRRRKRKVYLVGLNQLGLCEEPGISQAQEIFWDDPSVMSADPPVFVTAGNGTSFIITTHGQVYSWGNGNQGRLGHGDGLSMTVPRHISSLRKFIVTKISTGLAHTIAITHDHMLFAWGHNLKGQVGIASNVNTILAPTLVTAFKKNEVPIDISCGDEFSLALVNVTNEVVNEKDTIILFGWGDNHHGQLGAEVSDTCNHPIENRVVTRFMRKSLQSIKTVSAGGSHVLLLTHPRGQLVSWGAGGYGQLGHGFLWDDSGPRFINNMSEVISLSGGKRHSMCVRALPGGDINNVREVYSWGYNAYGELGVGDIMIRLQPTKLTGGIETAVVESVNCGPRHSVIRTAFKPKRVIDDVTMNTYFKIIEKDPENEILRNILKRDLQMKEVDPSLLDNPMACMPKQTGLTTIPLKNNRFDEGLRYCLDTNINDSFDWRRKVYETCFECTYLKLTSICLSCARLCKSKYLLRPYIRKRSQGHDQCDCNKVGICYCRYTVPRAAFDKVCNDNNCIYPCQLRNLLQSLRAPLLVEGADMEVALLALAEGCLEDNSEMQIQPLAFEKWYEGYYE